MNERTITIPDATRAGLHPIVEATERRVHDFLKRWPVNGDEARGMIRVEITREIRDQLLAYLSPYSFNAFDSLGHVEGPMKIMGVSYYVVDTLPEPGWRILP